MSQVPTLPDWRFARHEAESAYHYVDKATDVSLCGLSGEWHLWGIRGCAPSRKSQCAVCAAKYYQMLDEWLDKMLPDELIPKVEL